jgi:hypothetical protein
LLVGGPLSVVVDWLLLDGGGGGADAGAGGLGAADAGAGRLLAPALSAAMLLSTSAPKLLGPDD